MKFLSTLQKKNCKQTANNKLKPAKDFGIDKPRIAVLGLNPHAGDEGLIGNEEETIIKPAIREAKNNSILAVGPYSADAFLPAEALSNLMQF